MTVVDRKNNKKHILYTVYYIIKKIINHSQYTVWKDLKPYQVKTLLTTELHHCLWVEWLLGVRHTTPSVWNRKKCSHKSVGPTNWMIKGYVSSGGWCNQIARWQRNWLLLQNTEEILHALTWELIKWAANNWAGMCTVHISILSEFYSKIYQTNKQKKEKDTKEI